MSEESDKSAGSNESIQSVESARIRQEFQQSLNELWSKVKPLSTSRMKKEGVIQLRGNLVEAGILEERVLRDEKNVADIIYLLEEEIAYVGPIPLKYLRKPFSEELGERAANLHYILEPLLRVNGFEFCPNGGPDFHLLLSSETDTSVLDAICNQMAKWKAVDCTPSEIRDAMTTLSRLGFKISIYHIDNKESLVYTIMACLPLVVRRGSNACLYTSLFIMQHKPSENQPTKEYTIPPATGA